MLRIGQSIRCSAGVETAAKATPKAQTQKKSTASGSSKKITVQASSSATASLGENTNTMNDVELLRFIIVLNPVIRLALSLKDTVLPLVNSAN